MAKNSYRGGICCSYFFICSLICCIRFWESFTHCGSKYGVGFMPTRTLAVCGGIVSPSNAAAAYPRLATHPYDCKKSTSASRIFPSSPVSRNCSSLAGILGWYWSTLTPSLTTLSLGPKLKICHFAWLSTFPISPAALLASASSGIYSIKIPSFPEKASNGSILEPLGPKISGSLLGVSDASNSERSASTLSISLGLPRVALPVQRLASLPTQYLVRAILLPILRLWREPRHSMLRRLPYLIHLWRERQPNPRFRRTPWRYLLPC